MASDNILMQASVVAVAGRALMITGVPGSGKSSLALALIDRGAMLVGDDGVALHRQGAQIIAAPPPNIAGKMEVRNVGLIDLPCTSAPLALILTLDNDAPRYPEPVEQRDILGLPIPTLPFRAGDAVQALRAEWALRLHGIGDWA